MTTLRVRTVPRMHYAYDADRFDLAGTRFVRLDADADTRAFVNDEQQRHHGRVRWTARALARSALNTFSANALFDTYPLFMLSTAQWAELLGVHAGGTLLDVGAAAGHVTARIAPLFDSVLATDVSRPMVRRLRQRGLRADALDLTTAAPDDAPFDAVALLNVLDRCARPLTLLHHAIDATRRGGTVMVSMPLPYEPCWYDGPVERPPLQRLDVRGATWEESATALTGVLRRAGLTIEAVTRAPYLSGGDRHQRLYVLDAAIVVSRRT